MDQQAALRWVRCSFSFEGETVPEAACRRKGNMFDWDQARKPQFVVRFNLKDKMARFRGLRRLNLEGRTPVFESEHRIRHKDRGYRWVLSRGLAVRSAGIERQRAGVSGGQHPVHEAGQVERSLAGEEPVVAAPLQDVHREQRGVRELEEEDLLGGDGLGDDDRGRDGAIRRRTGRLTGRPWVAGLGPPRPLRRRHRRRIGAAVHLRAARP